MVQLIPSYCGQNGGRIEPCPHIMKKEPHATDQQDKPPGAEGHEEAGREFILFENPEKEAAVAQ